MPKFKKETIHIRTSNDVLRLKANEDEQIMFTADIMVNASGIFYIKLPDDIIDRCKELQINLDRLYGKGMRTPIDNIIKSETYDNLLLRIKTVLDPLVTYEILSRNYVIRYSFGGSVSYTTNKDNEIEFNGQRRGEQGLSWWWADTDQSYIHHDPYSVTIGVEVHEKIVIKFSGGKEKIIYNRVTSVDKEKHPNLYELLRVVRIKVAGKYQEIEYTEQTAKAFCVALLGIIKIYDSLQKFNHVETFLDFASNDNNLKLLGNE